MDEDLIDAEMYFDMHSQGIDCAILSVYGEDLSNGVENPQYSEADMKNIFEEEKQEQDLNLQRHLEKLEIFGYLDRYDEGYRVSESEEFRQDAVAIYEFREEVIGAHPQNLAFAFESADQQELQNKGVRLVQEPGS